MNVFERTFFIKNIKAVCKMLLSTTTLSNDPALQNFFENNLIKNHTNSICQHDSTNTESNVFDRVFFDETAKSKSDLIQSNLSSFVNMLSYDPEFVALRITTDSLTGNIDSFMITTSSNPNEQIIYTSPTDLVDLNVKDGGYF